MRIKILIIYLLKILKVHNLILALKLSNLLEEKGLGQKIKGEEGNTMILRKKIKRNFFNKILVKKMNKELKKGGSRKYFALFPSEIAADVTRERNKKLLNMTLRQVITNSELYKSKSYNNFIHNINVLESLNDSKNNILENLLNSKYSELFAQYLKSDSFENDVNKLKQKEEKEIYIERYEYLSKTWLEFFSN